MPERLSSRRGVSLASRPACSFPVARPSSSAAALSLRRRRATSPASARARLVPDRGWRAPGRPPRRPAGVAGSRSSCIPSGLGHRSPGRPRERRDPGGGDLWEARPLVSRPTVAFRPDLFRQLRLVSGLSGDPQSLSLTMGRWSAPIFPPRQSARGSTSSSNDVPGLAVPTDGTTPTCPVWSRSSPPWSASSWGDG